jgi:hypothetical protein
MMLWGDVFASLFREGGAMAASNTSVGVRTQSPSYQAYQILQLAFVVAPMIAGVDKFFHVLVNWDQYLSPLVATEFDTRS